jgi:ABC-type multidrug transport system fused ATPase/permease subunit
MVSVERVLEYSTLPPEESDDTHKEAPAGWPSRGAIEFQNVSMKYHGAVDNVLKQISFTIAPKEKIGIVGRTGAGSSTQNLLFFLWAEIVVVALLFRKVFNYCCTVSIGGIE